jgi:hypothetical protein
VGILPRPTPDQKGNPDYTVLPRYWVSEKEIADRLDRSRHPGWLLGWRDICRSSDVRTLIAAAIPPGIARGEGRSAQANLSSFVVDFCARQKMTGTSLSYMILKQLPLLPPARYRQECPWEKGKLLADWITPRVLELNYTACDMAEFARQHGDDGPPFRWDDQRRFRIRAELDAAYFHLCGVVREDVSYIMDTFRAFRKTHPELFTSTKDTILQTYDAMTEAMDQDRAYCTALDPPPAQGSRHPGVDAAR